jgi:RNA polymerase sigma factor (sigma-70 family)
MTDRDSDITATVLRERSKLGNFIRRRVLDQTEAEDILQDVFHKFVEAYRLPAPIEQASAWLFQVARNRIVDRFRKKRELPVTEIAHDLDNDDIDYRLDLALPAPDAGPDSACAFLPSALVSTKFASRSSFISFAMRSSASSHDIGVHWFDPGARYSTRVRRLSLWMKSIRLEPFGQSVPRLTGWSGSPSI